MLSVTERPFTFSMKPHPMWKTRSIAMAVVLLTAAGLTTGCQLTEDAEGVSLNHAPDPTQLEPAQVSDVQLAFARTLENKGNKAEAAAVYARILQTQPEHAKALHRLAILRDQEGRFQESEKLFQQALKQDPGRPDIFCDIGYSYYLQHRWSEAEINLRQAIALSPDHRRAHNHLGLVLGHAGRSEEALAEFHRAGCTTAQAHANLAFTLSLERRLEEARQQYRLAQLADPKSEDIASRLRELDALAAYLPQSDRLPQKNTAPHAAASPEIQLTAVEQPAER